MKLRRHPANGVPAATLPRTLAVLLLLACTAAPAREPDWSRLDALLAAHVQPATLHGVTVNAVDYAGLATDQRLDDIIGTLQNHPLDALEGRAERLAFYINAYNVLALAMVADHLPLASIKDIGSVFRPVWKRTAGRLGGEDVSLDDIEHGRLRKLGDPRVHMAIVCASVSCPDLRTEAYRAARLDEQLDDQARRFLGNAGKGARRDGDTLAVSRIFDWFAEDFAVVGGVEAFIRRYREVPDEVDDIDASIDYDWRLNGSSGTPRS
ncbi:MAG: DUF547 domain-containing protein [Gammaproteobacteria bacterium]